MQFTHRLVADAFAVSQAVSAHRSDKAHPPVSFVVGQQVLLSSVELAAGRTATADPSLPTKLLDRWVGPFTIAEVRGPRTYRLAGIPDHFGWHDVFDVSRLKAFMASADTQFPARRSTRRPPAPVVRDNHDEYEVERILDHRKVRSKHQFLVLWKGHPVHEASWQPVENLVHAKKSISSFDPSFVFPRNFAIVFSFLASPIRHLVGGWRVLGLASD
jgi:hypothetical protein